MVSRINSFAPRLSDSSQALPQPYKRLAEIALLCLADEKSESETKFIRLQNIKVPMNA